MPKTNPPAAPQGNQLLARLPPEEYQRLLPRMQLVPLALKQMLFEARSPIDYAYFPNRGVVSALTVMEDGRAIEVATVGDEGMVGLPLLIGAKTTGNRLIVQVPGEAMRMAADLEKKMREYAANLEFEKAAALRDELIDLRRQIGGNESLLFQGKAPKIFDTALKELV